MPTSKETISVRVDAMTKRKVERAAALEKQSSGAFLSKAGEERAQEVLLTWALKRHEQGDASFSELAAETGLAIEELMLAANREGATEELDAFLESCRA